MNSFAELNAERVAKACRDYLEARRVRIAEMHETFIKEKTQARRWGNSMTREQAEKEWETGSSVGFFSNEQDAIWVGYSDAKDVEGLLALAVVANSGIVMVDRNDFILISEFFNTENHG